MKICVQSGNVADQLGHDIGYAMIRETGFTAIDWNLDHAINRKEIKNKVLENVCIFEQSLEACLAHYADELAIIRANGLEISQAHAPFPAYLPERPELLDYMIGIYRRCIEFCDAIGCKNLIIHGISLQNADLTNSPESIRALNYKLYESLIDVVVKTNVTVCLENLFSRAQKGMLIAGACANPYEAVEMIDALNAKAGRECFGLCLDTGHLNLLHTSFRAYIPILGHRIKALHIHDNDGVGDQHMMPYTGTVCWEDFCRELKAVGYSGDLSFETFNQTDVATVHRELIPVFLRAIAQIGEFFKSKIEG